jgi:hypothetical protein
MGTDSVAINATVKQRRMPASGVSICRLRRALRMYQSVLARPDLQVGASLATVGALICG